MSVITNKKQKSPPPPQPVRALQGLTLNIRGMTPAKWLSIQELPVFSSLDYIILTEHQLSAEFRPDEIIKSGCNAYTAEKIESHITPLDSHTLFRRMGDTNPAHSPACPLTTATAPATGYRGRLLLNMLSSIKLLSQTAASYLLPPSTDPTLSSKNRTHTLFSITIL